MSRARWRRSRRGFRDRLELSGYAPESRVVHLRLMTDLSGWLGERGLDGSALSASVADGFVRDCRASGRREALTSADVIAFMLACSESASPATVQRTYCPALPAAVLAPARGDQLPAGGRGAHRRQLETGRPAEVPDGRPGRRAAGLVRPGYRGRPTRCGDS